MKKNTILLSILAVLSLTACQSIGGMGAHLQCNDYSNSLLGSGDKVFKQRHYETCMYCLKSGRSGSQCEEALATCGALGEKGSEACWSKLK